LEKAGLLRLWHLPDVDLVTSDYAVKEAIANLPDPEQRNRLETLLQSITVTPHSEASSNLPSGIHLPAKDAPIFHAAMTGGATILLTGDVTHFGRFFGKTVAGVRILLPADFLREHQN